MTNTTAKPPTDWVRRASGGGIVAAAGASVLATVVGLGFQLVFFGDYGQRVQAELYRPLIVGGLLALVATLVAGVTWWLAFVKERES